MKVYLGTDHAGFELKEQIKAFLKENSYEVEDCGASSLDQEDDYPDFIAPTAAGVAKNPEVDRGIIFGGSGQGEAMVANKCKGIRAAVYNTENLELVKLARIHNDANILSIGARFVGVENAKEAVKLFLDTTYTAEERHERRIEKIKNLEGES